MKQNSNKILMWIVGAVIITGLLTTYAYTKAEGTAITVCVRHNGTVYVIGGGFRREECRGNDQLLSWNVQGPVGPQGPAGPQGPQGIQGPAGTGGGFDFTRFYYRRNPVRLPPSNEFGGITAGFADCDAGDTIISGGASVNFDDARILASYPIGSGSWYAAASNQNPVEKVLTIVAYCFDTTP